MDLWDQSQPGLYIQFQASQVFVVRLCLTKRNRTTKKQPFLPNHKIYKILLKRNSLKIPLRECINPKEWKVDLLNEPGNLHTESLQHSWHGKCWELFLSWLSGSLSLEILACVSPYILWSSICLFVKMFSSLDSQARLTQLVFPSFYEMFLLLKSQW